MIKLKNKWKYEKFIRNTPLTLAEYTISTSKETPSNPNYIFNLTPYTKLNDPIFIRNNKHIPLPPTSIPTKLVKEQLTEFTNSLYWRLYFKDRTEANKEYNPNFKIIPKPKVSTYPSKLYTYSHEHTIARKEIEQLNRELEPILLNNPRIRNKKDNTITNLLKEFPDVKLCLADKNLGFTALFKSHYEKLVLAHLSNENTYLENSHTIQEITLNTKNELLLLRNHLQGHLTPAENQFLIQQLQQEPSFPSFKGLPKIHKKGELNVRPIVTSFNWYTRPVAIMLNERIKQQQKVPLPYVINSSTELIHKLPKKLVKNQLLITIDVKAMYPSIDRPELLEALNTLHPNEPILPIFLNFILKNSYCEFNGKAYLQIQGIPMGDNASVCLANLFCAVYLDQTIANCDKIIQYYRYIDDIFIIWSGSKEELTFHIDNWNTLSSLTLEPESISSTTINFLDITIYKEGYTNNLQTKLFHKPIAKFNYLSPASCHPPHTLSGWIYAEIKRYYRLNTNPTIRYIKLDEFKKKLLTRGYKYTFLDPIFNKAQRHYFTHSPNPNPDNNSNPKDLILPFFLPYYPDHRSQNIYKTINQSLRRITSKVLPQHRPILVHSILPNITSHIKK